MAKVRFELRLRQPVVAILPFFLPQRACNQKWQWILLSGQSHLVNFFVENKKRLAIGNRQGLAPSLLKLREDRCFSQVVNPLHNSNNCESVSKLADLISVNQAVGLK